MKKYFVIISLVFSIAATADNLSIPYQFLPGSTIKSADMNANFSTISSNVNQKGTAINSLEESITTIGIGINNLQQSTEANGLTLTSINAILNNINVSLNSIDTKLATIFSAPINDQLICFAYSGFPVSAYPYDCVQTSNPTIKRSLTFLQVIQEGWRLVSVGGGDWATFIFNK